MLIIFLFASKEARNVSLTAHGRKRRANDGSVSHEDDDDDDDSSADYPDWDWYDEEFPDPAKKEPRFLKSEQMAVLMAEGNESLLYNMGHHFEDMVLSCTYRGVPCR